MFRSVEKAPVFHSGSFRIIALTALILAFLVSAILIVSLEQEKFVLQGLLDAETDPVTLIHALWNSRHDLIVLTVLFLLLGAIVMVAFVSYLHYDSTRRALEEVKGLARNILQNIPTGVLTVSQSGLITTLNPTAELVLRRTSSELLGESYDKVFPEGDAIRSVIHSALHARCHVHHKDLYREDAERTSLTIRVSTAELTDEDGRPAGLIMQAQDVTEWLTLEQRVRVAEKLAALHTLSAGVAHELLNPLSAVDLNLQLMEEELRDGRDLPSNAEHYLNVLKTECRRLATILDNFMKFARPGAMRHHEVDVKGLVAHLGSLLEHEAKERHVELYTKVPQELPLVRGDETQISQALLNILVNALQAMPAGGVCGIEALPREVDHKEWVEISVRDTGVGIKSEESARLFEPFYTTKPSGSGLGLAIAYRIIQDHAGSIEIDSNPGVGTQVVVRLPVVPAVRQTDMVGT